MLAFFEDLSVEIILLLVTALIAIIQKLVEWSKAVRRRSEEAQERVQGRQGVDFDEFRTPPPPPEPEAKPIAPPRSEPIPIPVPGGWMPGPEPAPEPPEPIAERIVVQPPRIVLRPSTAPKPRMTKAASGAPMRRVGARRRGTAAGWGKRIAAHRDLQRQAIVLYEVFGPSLAMRSRRRRP